MFSMTFNITALRTRNQRRGRGGRGCEKPGQKGLGSVRDVERREGRKWDDFSTAPSLPPPPTSGILGGGRGSRDGAVESVRLPPMWRRFDSPGPGVICGLSLLLVLVLAPRGFSSCTPVYPSPQKPAFPNSNSIWNPRATSVSVPDF